VNVNDNKQTTNCADDVTERHTLIALDSGMYILFLFSSFIIILFLVSVTFNINMVNASQIND